MAPMGITGLHHLVLLVDDVPAGEAYYRDLFDAEVLFREAALDGDPGTLPEETSWDEALAAGVDPYMSFLGAGDFYLAVAAADGDASKGMVDHVALAVDDAAFESITANAEALGCEVTENAPHHRLFADRYGFEWELNAKPRPPGEAFEPLDV